MKLKLPALHTQILVALVLGAVFGAFLNVDPDFVVVERRADAGEERIEIADWEEILIVVPTETATDTLRFGADDQLQLVAAARKLRKAKQPFTLVAYDFLKNDDAEKTPRTEIDNIIKVRKERTLATSIKWIGDIFINLLNMIAIPLVLASLIVGAASLGDIRKFARIGGKTVSYYVFTTAVAVTIGLTLANLVEPGKRMNEETRDKLMSVYSEDSQDKLEAEVEFDVGKELIRIVPKNPLRALAEGEMLQIVFFAVVVGMVLTMIRKEKAAHVVGFFDGLSEAMIKTVDIVMYIAPLGVFALIAATVSEFGFSILETLIWYSAVVVLGLALQAFGTYSVMLKLFSKIKLSKFFRGIRKAQTIGFSTSSSAATLPVTMEACQENLGVSRSITSFVLPLGATINMDGTAMYQGIATVFIAQVFGMDLSIGQQLTVVMMATFASIGTAPVPGVGLIMLIVILRSVGVPQEGVALVLGVDRILDMLRTVTNVTGDAAATTIVASTEKELDERATTEGSGG